MAGRQGAWQSRRLAKSVARVLPTYSPGHSGSRSFPFTPPMLRDNYKQSPHWLTHEFLAYIPNPLASSPRFFRPYRARIGPQAWSRVFRLSMCSHRPRTLPSHPLASADRLGHDTRAKFWQSALPPWLLTVLPRTRDVVRGVSYIACNPRIGLLMS